MEIRLNKFLAQCGLGSRRKVEELITAGRIRVNGNKTRSLSTTVDPDHDTIEFDGKKIKQITNSYYIMMNKPRGYITTLSDEKGRPTVMDLLPEKYKMAGVFPIGRLDKDTEGLLLLTNDGELAHKLNHSKFKVNKEYLVELNRDLDEKDKLKIEKGVYLHQLDIKTRRSKIRFNSPNKKFITITIDEGKKRQIRYTFKNFGYSVQNLRRVSYGPIKLSGVNRGSIRELKAAEIKKLKNESKGSS